MGGEANLRLWPLVILWQQGDTWSPKSPATSFYAPPNLSCLSHRDSDRHAFQPHSPDPSFVRYQYISKDTTALPTIYLFPFYTISILTVHLLQQKIYEVPTTLPGTVLGNRDSAIKNLLRDFPGGPVVKNPPANAGDTGFIPGPGRPHMPWNN